MVIYNICRANLNLKAVMSPLALVVAATLFAGCGGVPSNSSSSVSSSSMSSSSVSSSSVSSSSVSSSSSSVARGDAIMGEVWYNSTTINGQSTNGFTCVRCHGEMGDGDRKINERDFDTLVNIIQTSMPATAAGICNNTCAKDIAAFILTW